MDADEREKLKLLAKERAKENAKMRMSQIGGGDFSRGFGTKEKVSNLEKEPETKSKTQLNSKPTAPTQANGKNVASKGNKNVNVQQSVTPSETKEGKPSRLGKIVVDSSAINTMTTATNDSKRRRKKLIISILVVAIVLIWVFIVFTKLIKPQKPDHNCHMYLSGNAKSECVLLLDGEKNSEWHTPTGISPQCTYDKFKVELTLPSEGNFDVRFRIEVYNKNKLVSNFGTIATLPTYQIKVDSSGNVWRELKSVQGGQNVMIMSGITFFDVSTSPDLTGISSASLKINIYIEVNRA